MVLGMWRGTLSVIASICVVSACGSSASHNNTTSRLQVIVSATSGETARFETTYSDDKGPITVADGVRDFGKDAGSEVCKNQGAPAPDPNDHSSQAHIFDPTESRFFGTVIYAKGGQAV